MEPNQPPPSKSLPAVVDSAAVRAASTATSTPNAKAAVFTATTMATTTAATTSTPILRPSAMNGWAHRQSSTALLHDGGDGGDGEGDGDQHGDQQDHDHHDKPPPAQAPAGGSAGDLLRPRGVPMLTELLRNNRLWAERMTTMNPQFFHKLAQQQSPKILWIGCSDSRGGYLLHRPGGRV